MNIRSRLFFIAATIIGFTIQSVYAMHFANLKNLGFQPISINPAYWHFRTQEIKKQLAEQSLTQDLLQHAKEVHEEAKHAGQYSYAQQLKNAIEQAQQRESEQNQQNEEKKYEEIIRGQQQELQKQARIIADQQEQINILKTEESNAEKKLRESHEREIKSLHNRLHTTQQQLQNITEKAKQQGALEQKVRETIKLQTNSLIENLEEHIKKLIGKNNILKQNQQLLKNEKENVLNKLLEILQELAETKKQITEVQVQNKYKYHETAKQVAQLQQEQSADGEYTQHLEKQLQQREKELINAQEKIAQMNNTIDILESNCASTESFRTIEAEDNEHLKAENKNLRNDNFIQKLKLKDCKQTQQRLERELAHANEEINSLKRQSTEYSTNGETLLSTNNNPDSTLQNTLQENTLLQNKLAEMYHMLEQNNKELASVIAEKQNNEKQHQLLCQQLLRIINGKQACVTVPTQETLKAVEAKIEALAGLSTTVDNLQKTMNTLVKLPGGEKLRQTATKEMQNLTMALKRKNIV